MKSLFVVFVAFVLLYLVLLPSYISWLPTFPVYPPSEEAFEVLQATRQRTPADELFYYKTDPSVAHAFVEVVPLTLDELNAYITHIRIVGVILLTKYTINRPRPHQVLPSIQPMESTTAHTPSFPAGHAFQAYCLAYMLENAFPRSKERLWEVATQCDDVRVKAGLHFPSDGRFSRRIVDTLHNIGWV
jgi:membrane-associated phospholipid phosphatase